MSKRKTKLVLESSSDHTSSFQISEIIDSISKRIYEKLESARTRGQVIGHNLEHGLGVENVVRDLFREILPKKFGIAKGKLINKSGKTTRHLDLIVYDCVNYPAFFVDDHHNMILPIESAYAVIEIKSQTTSTVLRGAYENLQSVSNIAGEAQDCSTNDFIVCKPPLLSILSLYDERTLESIADNFAELSEEFKRDYSFQVFSEKSPGSKENTGHNYLVHEIIIAGKGAVYNMLNGKIAIGRWGEKTFVLNFGSLVSDFAQIKLKEHNPRSYLNWLQSGKRDIYIRAADNFDENTPNH